MAAKGVVHLCNSCRLNRAFINCLLSKLTDKKAGPVGYNARAINTVKQHTCPMHTHTEPPLLLSTHVTVVWQRMAHTLHQAIRPANPGFVTLCGSFFPTCSLSPATSFLFVFSWPPASPSFFLSLDLCYLMLCFGLTCDISLWHLSPCVPVRTSNSWDKTLTLPSSSSFTSHLTTQVLPLLTRTIPSVD